VVDGSVGIVVSEDRFPSRRNDGGGGREERDEEEMKKIQRVREGGLLGELRDVGGEGWKRGDGHSWKELGVDAGVWETKEREREKGGENSRARQIRGDVR